MNTSYHSLSGKIPVLYSGVVGSTPADSSCEQCGLKTDNPRFCSLSCSTTWQMAAKAWPIGYCKFCGSVFSKKRKSEKVFCNHSCAAKYNNPERKEEKLLLCVECHEKNNGNGTKFCSRTCHQKFDRMRKLESWIFGGEWSGYTEKSGTSSVIRNALIELWNNKCALCGWGEVNKYTGMAPLELEHMDGNHKNNRPSNLIILCPNCHSLTATYKALNKGNGRSSR